MSARLTLATARRVLLQVRGDHRTLAMLIAVPCVLIGLLAWIFNGTPVFDKIGAPLLGVFPFVVMFLITSVATLRERSSGTLERLLSTPLADATPAGLSDRARRDALAVITTSYEEHGGFRLRSVSA